MGKGGLILLIVLVAFLLFGLFALVLLPYFFGINPLSDLVNVIVNVTNQGGSNDGSGGNGGTTPPPDDGEHPTSIKPSSLAAFVAPNPMTMGGWVRGVVTADGNNYAITIHAKHKGENVEQTFPGFLGSGANFELITTLSTPGYWSFWATLDADPTIISNTVDLTCRGILIVPDKDTYSKTFDDSLRFRIYSNMVGNVQIIANYPAGSYSAPITSCVINSGGFGEFSVNLDSLTNGDWQFDVLIGSEKASDYGGDCWIDIGR